jgi:hypothetical protein
MKQEKTNLGTEALRSEAIAGKTLPLGEPQSLDHLGKFLTNKEIAEHLKISPPSVKKQTADAKRAVRSRPEPKSLLSRKGS